MGDIEEFYDEIWEDIRADGPRAVSEARALATMYRISHALREARKARGLTQKQLAEMTGIAQPEISRIESGQVNTTVPTLGALVWAMGLQLAFVPVPELTEGPVR